VKNHQSIRRANHRFSPQEVIDAVEKKYGLITYVARHLGCSAALVYSYREKYPAVEEAFKRARQSTVDLAETGLIRNIKRGDVASIIFALKCLAKDRGYQEKSVVEVQGSLRVAGRDPAEVRAELADRIKRVMAANQQN
jgi:hypothetical protein